MRVGSSPTDGTKTDNVKLKKRKDKIMGYPINSVWTEMRKDDIAKLNAIIDNRYCQELAIGAKLNLLNIYKEKLNEAISNFNFEIVISFMRDNNWTWSKSNHCVPSKKDIIDVIEDECFTHCIFDILEKGEHQSSWCTGGIIFDMYMTASNIYLANRSNCTIFLGFDIASYD